MSNRDSKETSMAEHKPGYEPPTVVSLGELAKGTGAGENACNAGLSAYVECQTGNAALRQCKSGGAAISNCNAGSAG